MSIHANPEPASGNVTLTPLSRYVGPPLLVPAVGYAVAFIASLALGGAMNAFATPSASAADVVAHAAAHPTGIQFVSVLQLVAALALGVFTATATSAIRSRGFDVASLQIARFGGYTASTLLILSAVSGWCTVELAKISAGDAAKFASLLSFVTGGPAHVVTLGLLFAGVSVPVLLARLAPRWIAIFGLVLAGLAAVAALSLGISSIEYVLPVVRFPSMVWIIAIAATLLRPARSAVAHA